MTEASQPIQTNSAGITTTNGTILTSHQVSNHDTVSAMPSSRGENHINRAGSDSPVSQHEAALSDHSGPSASNAPRPRTGPSPLNGTGGSPLNPRSCVTCRKRKVRCDKRHPCINCNKAGIECVFPGPGRAPRRSRKPPDTELLARLRKLEGLIKDMGRGIELEEVSSTERQNGKPIEVNGTLAEKGPGCNTSQFFSHLNQNDDARGTAKMVKDFGRLVVEDGRSRYVSNRFWNSLSEEVAEMRDILDDPSDEEEDFPSPASGSATSGSAASSQGFLFNFSSTAHSLRNFHPPLTQIPMYWEIFKENVDPVLRILHRPHTEQLIRETVRNLDHISKPIETMMFAIYYAVVTSMNPQDCLTVLGMDKDSGLKKYRFAFEQALARANFLSTQEVLILQSLTLYLTCARRSDDTRYVWALSGLLIRLATALGIHRDGSHFNLSPFDTEMRRRLWWHICTLDVRASEDHGVDPAIVESTFDTKFPSNINDTDISPSSTETPKELDRWTETTFDLIRYSVSTTVRRLSWAPPGPGPCRTVNTKLTVEDKEHIIEELHQYLEKKYLKYCDLSVPLNWVAATVTRLIMAKMWLVVHHPLLREDRGAGLSQETLDRLFLTSVEVIEFSRLLETEKATRKWGWLFATYQQWHAMAYVLSQLTVRTTGPEVERAWPIIDAVFKEWHTGDPTTKKGMLWKPLRKMMIRARAARATELAKRRRFPLDGSLGPTIANTDIPPAEVMPGLNASSNPLDYTGLLPFVNNPIQTIYPFDSDGLQPMLAMESSSMPPQYPASNNGNGNNVDQWLYDETASYPGMQQDPLVGADGNMNWVGWEEMVKDFAVQGGQPAQNGLPMMNGDVPAVMGGMTNWW